MLTFDEYCKGIVSTDGAKANAKITVAFANDILSALGEKIRVTSTVRTAIHNKQVNGVPNSKHLNTRALAIDFVPKNYGDSIMSVVRAIAKKHRFGVLIHDVGSGNHIHCEFKG